MISKDNLIILAKQKLSDWKVLFHKNCIDNSVYLCWYWIEIALKLSICKIFKFGEWFPENPSEFKTYSRQLLELKEVIQDIKQIRNHDLRKISCGMGSSNSLEWIITIHRKSCDTRRGWGIHKKYRNITHFYFII